MDFNIGILREKLDHEMNEFKSSYNDMSITEVYNDWYIIGFNESYYELLFSDYVEERLDKDVLKWLSSKETPLSYLYDEWLSCDGHTSYGWDDMIDWLESVYSEEKHLEKQELYNNINSLGLKDVPEKNDEYFHGFDYFAHVSTEPFVFSANFPNNFDKDVDKDFAAFFNEKLLVKSCDYGCDTYPNGVTKDIEGLGEYTFQQSVWNFIEATEQMFECKCHFYEGYNGFEFAFEFGSDDKRGCYVLAAGNNGQEYSETLYLTNPELIHDPQMANTIISIDKALYTLLEEHSLKREGRDEVLADIKRITKNDLLHCETVFDFNRPKTKFQSEAVVDYVEFEVIKPERFEKLARNLARCGNTDGWDESLLEEVNNKDSSWYEHIMLYVHIIDGTVDKIYTECTTCDDCDSLVTEQVFDEDEIETIKDTALKLYKENALNRGTTEKKSLSDLDVVIKCAEEQKCEQKNAQALNNEYER